jgi:phosphonopyruvate decarboxylase
MESGRFINFLGKLGVAFYVGVPDSQLKSFINQLVVTLGINTEKHIIAANEGNAVAIAAGYHLATGEVACVYLQNSGLGNIFNPATSLISRRVYSIPCVFVIGWRGKPGVPDEPQHVHQGQITQETLKLLDIDQFIISEHTKETEIEEQLERFQDRLRSGASIAFIVDKGGLSSDASPDYKNHYSARRENIIEGIVRHAQGDLIVATTGKTSRELFEIRERNNQPHDCDFLTVGSMGHCSSVALGIALNIRKKRVWCIDGDGAALMHMGAMTSIGACAPSNLVHILINNEAHESVGGQPTLASRIDFCTIAKGCNYASIESAGSIEELETILQKLDHMIGPVFIEVMTAIGSRHSLGRPTISPIENKKEFMQRIRMTSKCGH